MIRRIIGVSLSDRISSEELVSILGMDKAIVDCIETNKLRWHGRLKNAKLNTLFQLPTIFQFKDDEHQEDHGRPGKMESLKRAVTTGAY